MLSYKRCSFSEWVFVYMVCMAATSFRKLRSLNGHLAAVLQGIGLTDDLFFDWPRITLPALPPVFEC